MPESINEREALTSRSIPYMTLSTGDESSLTGPPLPMPHYLSSEGRAVMRFSITGNAVITGGAGTLALVNARALLEHGLHGLALLDLDPSNASSSIQQLREDFPNAVIIEKKVNVTDEGQVQRVIAESAHELGSIDILCCFAGVVGCTHAIDMTVEEWKRTLDINTTGSFLCAQAVAKEMVKAGQGGVIVFIASISAHRVNYPQPQLAYNASKASLLSIKSSLAAEWARYGIRVNTISPGYMDTVLNEGAGLEKARRTWKERNPMVLQQRCEGPDRQPSPTMDNQKFLHLFEEVLAPDTNRVKAATATLKSDYYPLPESLSLLLQLLVSDQSPSLRQLAATQARSLVPKHWKSLADNQKPQIRRHLLQKTLEEDQQLVRHASARVITSIAKVDIEGDKWPDLFDTLLQVAGSPNARHREVGTYIIFTTVEAFGESIMDRFEQILSLFQRTIRDPQSAEVRINSMLALSRIAIVLDMDNDEDNLKAVQDAVPQMVGVLKEAIDAGDEDRTTQCFEVFQTLLGCDTQVLNKHFKDLFQFMMNIIADSDLDEDARTQAMSFLMQCVRYRKYKVHGLRLGEPLTLRCLEIATEMGDEDPNEEEVSVPRSALALLDILASSLPPSQVVVPLLHAMGPYVNSPDPDKRQAGIMALGMCVEGAPDFINTQMHEIFPLVLRLLDDPEDKVRRAALDGVTRLAEDLSEDLGKEHEKLIPALVKHLDTATKNLAGPDDAKNIDTIKASCNAIDSLVDGLEPIIIKQYLSEVIPRLSRLITHPDSKIKMAAIGALGATAASAKESYRPYFEQNMRALSEYVRIKDDEEEINLRCATCDAMGSMASAVGPEAFQKFVRPLMEATEEGLHLDHPKLRETSFLFWGTMAKVYKSEFKSFLDGVVKALFESLETEESELEVELGEEAADLVGKEVTIGGKKVKVAASTDEEILPADDIEDIDAMLDAANDDDDSDWEDLNAVTAVAQEKEVAIEMIGEVLANVTRDYLPYIEKTVEAVLPLTEHSYEGVRRAAISTMFRLYAAVYGLQGEEIEKWKPGVPLDPKPKDEVMKLGEIIITGTVNLWQEEEDRATVTEINRNLAATLKLTGPALIADPSTLKPVTDILLQLLTKKHTCQQDLGDDIAADSDSEIAELLHESSEYDWLVIDTALDVIIALSISLGEQFAELWKMFEKPILRFASGSEHFERSTSVGVIAECVRGMQGAVTPWTKGLMKLLMHRLSDEDAETKSNAAYAVGLLLEHTQDEEVAAGKSLARILEMLEPLMRTDAARAKDNAAGCVARIVTQYPDRVPVDAILPALVDLLPLKEDWEENEPVWKMIVQFYSEGDERVLRLTERLLPAMAAVLGPPEEQLGEETREKIVELVRFLRSKQPRVVDEFAVLREVASG
ncbi:MAG: hypothetical protein LQ351_005697 [Letrouitia transgressa]|nr:MAG: hypothetical protein LQ351_005697 [Letrouitia transgressa]